MPLAFTGVGTRTLYKEYLSASPASSNGASGPAEQSVHSVVSTTTNPTFKVQARKHELLDWVKATPAVSKWFDKLARKSKSTAEVYASYLWQYFKGQIAPRGLSVDTWIAEVKTQHRNDEVEVKRSWASELEGWYLKQATLKRGSRLVLIAAVRAFFRDKVELSQGYDFTLTSTEEAVAESEQRQELTPLSKDEIKTIVEHRPSPLYKAIFLTQLSGGIAVKELVYFSKHGYKYSDQIRARKVPLKVTLIRSKTVNNGGEPYWTVLWDDAVDALANYLAEREGRLGHKLEKGEYLFVNKNDKPVSEADIQLQMKRLREWTGLEKNVPGKRTYRFRLHEFRDTLKTWCANKHVEDKISEFILGHEIDSNHYNKFAKTDEGERNIIESLEHVRPEVNILTGRGAQPQLLTAQKQEIDELRKRLDALTTPEGLLSVLREVYLKSGNTAPLEIVAKKAGLLKDAQKQLEDDSTPKPTGTESSN